MGVKNTIIQKYYLISCFILEKFFGNNTSKTNTIMRLSYKISHIAIAAMLITGCGQQEKPAETTPDIDTVVLSQNTIYLNQDELPPANDVARFLAGKPVDRFASVQNSDYYKDYAIKAQQQWTELKAKTLNPIGEWSKNNIPDFYNDTTCLFYPFGGPDLVFAFAFFPNESTYVLQGLENPGSLTMPDALTESQTREYLDSLLYSYRYINRFGFFVASHMADDFKNYALNGTIHLILYTLAMENCIITSYQNVYIDQFGTLAASDGKPTKAPYGYKITFVRDGSSKPKTIVYLRMDASDPPLTGRFEFPYFINSYKEKICYLKSASYLLQNNEFTIMRKILTDQCDRILQDESGLSYAHVLKNYDVDIFGTYTRPMKVFSYYKQEDLKAALEAKHSKALPFRIGYASQINETVLMACRRKGKYPEIIAATQPKETAGPVQQFSGDTIYKVQFKVSWNIIPDNDPSLKGLPGVDYYTDNSVYKYTVGAMKSEAECAQLLQQVRKKGFSDAFIVKFVNGQRIK